MAEPSVSGTDPSPQARCVTEASAYLWVTTGSLASPCLQPQPPTLPATDRPHGTVESRQTRGSKCQVWSLVPQASVSPSPILGSLDQSNDIQLSVMKN